MVLPGNQGKNDRFCDVWVCKKLLKDWKEYLEQIQTMKISVDFYLHDWVDWHPPITSPHSILHKFPIIYFWLEHHEPCLFLSLVPTNSQSRGPLAEKVTLFCWVTSLEHSKSILCSLRLRLPLLYLQAAATHCHCPSTQGLWVSEPQYGVRVGCLKSLPQCLLTLSRWNPKTIIIQKNC